MPTSMVGLVRTLALVGPTGAGKTALMEAILLAAAGRPEKVGDVTPEAKARGHSVEINLANFEYLGDRYGVIDCPGSVEFSSEADAALAAVDLAVVVAEPDANKAALLQPTLKELERLGVPHALFINKMDQARGGLDELLAALAPVTSAPLVARQIPIWQGEHVTGFVDLALERAFVYRPNQPSEQIEIAPELVSVEAEARFHMLEQLADFDDELMEQLLSDITPARDIVFADLVREMNEGLIVPVFFGSAINGFGIRRLLKALRHETSKPERAAERLGVTGPAAYAFKTSHAGQAGKLTLARVFGSKMSDGEDLTLPDGGHARTGGLFSLQGSAMKKIATADIGELVAIGKLEEAAPGQILSRTGKPQPAALPVERRPVVYSIAVAAANRKDDVRLSGALSKLLEEDPGLSIHHDGEGHQVLLQGQGEAHVRLTLDRLKRRFGVDIATEKPRTPYRETITKGVTQRGRHKKQTGGHGQFGDVIVEIKPQPRGAGFSFDQRITGGAVPKQWIPAVEQGVGDGLARGPLGFPVVDLAVTLIDGSYHTVDSSEMAFRTAGRIAMDEGLKQCGSVLLEPIDRLTVFCPTTAMSSITSALSSHRGQILGFSPRDGWKGWDQVEAYLPQSERNSLIAEVRSLTQGLGTYVAHFDHMAELSGRLADEVTSHARTAA